MERFTLKDSTYYEKALCRLQELENKLESGLLLELPCKFGDTVYDVDMYGCVRCKDNIE